ncbi:FG-GAP repeat domain-containing protein [Actinoplanes sp. NPDC049265]|uniref:FG-GAP repeat domain-containing protein n=1 Tax=Actinoplanes sp. NPDC049265 TaxID=3363902 RepID=UPI00371858BF
MNLRLRRAGLPIAVSAVVAAVAVTGTILANGTAGAETVPAADHVAAARAAAADMRKAMPALSKSKVRALAARAATNELDFGDLTGDGKADLAAIDSSGTMYVYPGKRLVYSGGTRQSLFGSRIKVGTGWGKFNSLVRHGDFNGDGRQDILTRDAKGNLAFYAGTGNSSAMFKKGTAAGTGWGGFSSITGAGDLNGDGKDDLLGQKTNGELALYTGTNNISKPFSTRGTIIGTGWKGDLLTAIGDVSGDGRTDYFFRNTKGIIRFYTSKSGTMPIGKGEDIIDDAEAGKFFKGIVGPGDLTSDSKLTTDVGLPALPDVLWQLKDGTLLIASPDSDMHDDEVVVGSGWANFRLF